MVNVDRQLIRVSAILAYATLPGGQGSLKSAFLIFSKETRIGTLRLRLHGRGFQSKRCHDLETASKTTQFRRVYTEPIQLLNPTVYVKKLSQPNTSSPRPNPESSFAFFLRYSAGAYRRKSQHFKTSLLVYCGMPLGL